MAKASSGCGSGRGRISGGCSRSAAHLYALTAPEFTHLLSPFPLVPAPVKAAALAAFHALYPTTGV